MCFAKKICQNFLVFAFILTKIRSITPIYLLDFKKLQKITIH